MYENVTYNIILQRMIDRVLEKNPGIDTRESSPIYNALAPAAMELEMMYIEFELILQETFADTASREYLIKRAAERGIKPYPATYALLKGEFTPTSINIPIGSRFNLNDLNYYVKAKNEDGTYQVECEELGVKGNQYFGDLIPIEYIDGLETAKLTELLIPGEDEEDTEDFRKRYFSSFETKPYGGNKKDYIDKTNSIAGVGSTKVTPIWNGGGTVKLTILNSNFDKASPTLIDTVQQIIDPTKDGHGLGVAPIGHIVTVTTADEIPINISVKLTFDEGYNWENTIDTATEVIENYLLELRKEWATSTETVVRIAQIETKLLSIDGVIDIENTTINGVNSNLIIDMNNIPVLGVIENE